MAELRLWDNETSKKVSLKTQPVKEDIDLYFPNSTGTLITNKNLVKVLEDQHVYLTSNAIVKPKIITTLLDGDTYDGVLKISEYKTTDLYIGEHTDTEWQVATDFDFSNIILTSKILINKYTFNPKVELPDTVFYVRCRFISNDMRSPWSDVRYFRAPLQGLRSIELIVKEDKLTPVIDLKPLETYGGMEVPEIKSLTFRIFEKGREIYSVTRDKFAVDKNVPINILKPNTDYEISCNIILVNEKEEQTSLLYKSLNIFIEKPILEHYVENGRKYVRGTMFRPKNYEDTHYKTLWEVFTDGNISVYKDDSLIDLLTLDITDIVKLGVNYKITCKYYGKESVKGGDYFTSETAELEINAYKKIITPLTCELLEKDDGSITLTTNSYQFTGEGEDNYYKTVVGFYKKADKNRILLYQIDTSDDLFEIRDHNVNNNENILNIPEHILGIVAKEASQNGEYLPELDLIIYKVGTSGDRTNSVIKTFKNRYDIKNINVTIDKIYCLLKINKLEDTDKVGNFEVTGLRLEIKNGDEVVESNVYMNSLTNNTTFEYNIGRLNNNINYIVDLYIITTKFIKKFRITDNLRYNYKCNEPIVNLSGEGLNKVVNIEFQGINGLPGPGENPTHTVTYLKLYKSGDNLNKVYILTNNKTSFKIPSEDLIYGTNYSLYVKVMTADSCSVYKRVEFITNNITVNLGGIKGAEGNIIANKYPTLEIYNYSVIGGSGFDAEHYSTTWKILDENDLVIWKVENDMNNLTRITARANLIAGKNYTIKAIAHSRRYGNSNEVSAIISYTHNKTNISVPDNLELLTFGNESGGIYGSIPENLIAGKRTYVGTWGNEFELRNICNNEVGPDNHFNYELGDRVSYNSKLYECIKIHKWKLSKAPDVDPTYWKEITEDLLLPSFEEVADSLGIAYNIQEPTFQNEEVNKFSYWGNSNPIGDLVRDNKWLKMLSPTTGRICYVTNKCLYNKISFNDIVSKRKEYLMVDKYTLRFGTRLYYVRATTEEEELLLQSLPINQGIDINNDVIVCNANIDKIGSIKVISNSRVGKSLASSRSCSFRLVITPIELSEAPFNINKIVFPVNKEQSFIYDKYTDTGYYGYLTKEEFINLEEFFLEIGLTEGLNLSNSISKWFVYYEHGRIIYRPNKPLKANLTFETLRKKGLVFGIDMGNYHSPTKYYFNKNNYKALFNIELMDTCRFNIVDLTNRNPQGKHYISDEDLYNKNIGLLNTVHTNLMFRTLTPNYNLIGYGNKNTNNTAISGTIIGNSFTDTKSEVNKNTDLHIGTVTQGYDLLYPFNVDIATRIIGKNIVIDSKDSEYLSRIGVLDTKNYMANTLYTDEVNDKLGWMPILVLN